MVLSFIFAVLALGAQTLPQMSQKPDTVLMGEQLEQSQTVEGLSRLVRMMRTTATPGSEAIATADKLISDAATCMRSGNNGEARRRLMHSVALLRGLPWNEIDEYVASLTLRTDMMVADSSLPFFAHLSQSYHSLIEASQNLQLHVLLIDPKSKASAPAIIRDMGIYDIQSRDMIDEPLRFDAAFNGIVDGSYLLTAEVLDGNVRIGSVASIPVQLVGKMQSERDAIEQRLARIREHESTKASIRYPFDLARSINLGRREMIRFDFAKEIQNSLMLLQALESGSDPLWRAKGDRKRHYWFREAGEIMPYRIYVPENWNGRSKLPLMMMLHGGGGNEDTSMDWGDGQLPKLAEQHGYVVVSPLGYRPLGAYGNPMMLPAVFGNPTREGRAVGDERRRRMLELSEKDVMNVLELVAGEYDVDRSRIYLAGHSMGSGGTWHLGAKYAETWAALAPLSGPFVYEDYPFERIKKMPIFYTEGTGATPSLEGSRVLARYLKDKGFNAVYMEVDGTHGSMVGMVLPKVFEFFNQHHRK